MTYDPTSYQPAYEQPAYDATSGAVPEAAADATPEPGPRYSAVVADDSPTLRRIVAGVLERAGFTVTLAEDGVEAVQTVFRVQPDVVVLDVQMPRVSGYVAARVLKDDWQTSDLPVLFLTSLGAASDRYWGARAGAEQFLTKDFEAPELVDAVLGAITAAATARGDRERLKPDTVELSDDDVLARVCDLLDRKLFEASVTQDITTIAADVHGYEETVAAVLSALANIVDCDLAGMLLLEQRETEQATYISVSREVTHQQYQDFVAGLAEAAEQATGLPTPVESLYPRVADPGGRLGAADPDLVDPATGLATFLSMPLRAGGRMLGLLALSSGTANAFGESALTTLRLVAPPAAVVVDHARLAGARAEV
jgi:twitching motility two-component system response regulator PilH